MNSRPLATKKSCGGGKTAKSSLNYGRRRMSCTSGKIRIRSSHDCRRAPSKQVPFFNTVKRIKKRMGYRRRCANPLNLKFPSIRDASSKSNIVRNAPRRKKKEPRALSPKLQKAASTPGRNHLSAPSYHISYKKALDVYKSMRKGNSFFPSRRVLWRNRHRLVRGVRFKKKTMFVMTTSFSRSRRRRFFAPNHLKKTRISRITKLLSGFKLDQHTLQTTLEMALIPLRNMILRKIKLGKENVTT